MPPGDSSLGRKGIIISEKYFESNRECNFSNFYTPEYANHEGNFPIRLFLESRAI